MVAKNGRFTPDQDKDLTETYVEVRVPSDQLACDPDVLRTFVTRYRQVSGDSNHTGREIVGRVITLRKNRKLPRLGISGAN